MKIGSRKIGPGNPPFVVAEISGNHCGSLDNARKLIKAAKRVGADAVKTQCYEADSITLDILKPDFTVQSGLWQGKKLYDLYKKCETPFAWHKDLYRIAKDEGITIFSSVFDFKAVDLLESLDCPAYKIASFEIVDIPLIEYAAKTDKPLIISTGLASSKEILEAKGASGGKAAFLHCTSEYPATVESANLGKIIQLMELLKFENVIGISDHTRGFIIPVMATALNASIIEKHLKNLRLSGYPSEDEEFSLFPDEFKEMINNIKSAWEATKTMDTSQAARQFRRSLYAIRDIKEGEEYTTQNIRSIRPGYGLPPKMLGKILGTKSKRNWKRGDPLS